MTPKHWTFVIAAFMIGMFVGHTAAEEDAKWKHRDWVQTIRIDGQDVAISPSYINFETGRGYMITATAEHDGGATIRIDLDPVALRNMK